MTLARPTTTTNGDNQHPSISILSSHLILHPPSHTMSNYKDPYQHGGSEYLAPTNVPPGAAAPQQHGYDGSAHPDAGYEYSTQYNSYTSTTPSSYEKNNESKPDLDGVHALGELGPGERERPGRMGLGQPTSSFAAMGPPPRSTGILRMWRKDERGKQWTRVSCGTEDGDETDDWTMADATCRVVAFAALAVSSAAVSSSPCSSLSALCWLFFL